MLTVLAFFMLSIYVAEKLASLCKKKKQLVDFWCRTRFGRK